MTQTTPKEVSSRVVPVYLTTLGITPNPFICREMPFSVFFPASGINEGVCPRARRRTLLCKARESIFVYENTQRSRKVHDIWFHAMFRLISFCIHVFTDASCVGVMGLHKSSFCKMFWVKYNNSYINIMHSERSTVNFYFGCFSIFASFFSWSIHKHLKNKHDLQTVLSLR